MKAHRILSPLFLTTLIAACGGGGGGGDSTPTTTPTNATPVTVTSGNYTTVGREAGAGSLAVTDSAINYNFLTGAAVSAEPAWAQFGLEQWRNLSAKFSGRAQTVVGVTTSQTDNCILGGSITYLINDLNGNENPDAGDSVAATFNSCQTWAGTVTGNLSIQIAGAPTGDLSGYPFSVGLTMTFNNLRAVSTSASATATGDISLQTSRTAAWIGTDVISVNSFSSSVTVGSTTRSRTISAYTATVNFYETYSLTRFNGTVSSSEFGNQTVALASTTDFRRIFANNYPDQGAATVTGANGGKIYVNVIDATQLTLALDANGDGTAEQSTTATWDSLR